MRLLDGPAPTEGRVEVCLNGVWGSIAHDGWDTNDALVVCNKLGYITTGTVYHCMIRSTLCTKEYSFIVSSASQ